MTTIYSFSAFISHFKNFGKLSDGLVKHLSSIAQTHQFREKNHVYNNVNRWKSKRELADYLLDNILLNQDGLIVLNKPYGVGAHPPRVNLNAPKVESRDDSYSLYDVLPYIGNALGVDHLIVAKSAEKYSTGVSVLACSEKVIDQLKTCRRRDMSNKKLTSKYLGVVLGQPMDIHKSETVKVALSTSPDGKTFQPVIFDVRKPPHTKDSRAVMVQYNALCTNGYGASLVEIKSNSTKWHFLRVYMAHKLAPLLGDALYGSRVQNCMGIPVAVNPFNIRSHPKILNSTVWTRLSLENGEETIIPCHIHLQEVTFTGWNKDRSDITVVAPTPLFFNWTCEQLNLEIKD